MHVSSKLQDIVVMI